MNQTIRHAETMISHMQKINN